jgi:hypothetical protein
VGLSSAAGMCGGCPVLPQVQRRPFPFKPSSFAVRAFLAEENRSLKRAGLVIVSKTVEGESYNECSRMKFFPLTADVVYETLSTGKM